jgi:hypothetical protein
MSTWKLVHVYTKHEEEEDHREEQATIPSDLEEQGEHQEQDT